MSEHDWKRLSPSPNYDESVEQELEEVARRAMVGVRAAILSQFGRAGFAQVDLYEFEEVIRDTIRRSVDKVWAVELNARYKESQQATKNMLAACFAATGSEDLAKSFAGDPPEE